MNRLSNSSSPYLLQHASNPVEWYPWGEEAFQRARAEEKPIFLSIGYSTCHWCHVMAHESFENETIAGLLNQYFICIKVDREERPDVDRLYMTYVQALTGSGGWPMSVWLTPELKPFFGGTYFPPEDRYGRVGFPSVLLQLNQLWRENRERLQQEAERAIKVFKHLAERKQEQITIEKEEILHHAYAEWSQSFDLTWGGFGRAPKFPRPSVLLFLMRYAKMRPSVEAEKIREMVQLTLCKMALGGLQDHLGGGFHRYSVDRIWQVPHFEKMLYDQAQLVLAYLEAGQDLLDGSTTEGDCSIAPMRASSSILDTLSRYAPEVRDTVVSAASSTGALITREAFFEVVRNTLDYVMRDLISPEGGFYAAEDADSKDETGTKKEGAFYVWSLSELEKFLSPEEISVLSQKYHLKTEGNIPKEYDPHGELVRKNILMQFEGPLEADSEFLKKIKKKLFTAREKRSRPHRDEKIVTAWNGLMISAFVKGGVCLQDRRYIEIAERALLFIKKHLYDPKHGVLFRSWYGGSTIVTGFAEDYACLIQGVFDFYEATLEKKWLEWAAELQRKMNELFWDKREGGYFSSPAGDPHLVVRMKEDYDGAEPAANSVAASNLLRFSRSLPFCFEDAAMMVEQIFQTTATTLTSTPTAVPQLLVALCESFDFFSEERICVDETCSIDKN